MNSDRAEPVPAESTPRQRFIAALERRSAPGRVPHFELIFYLTMEAFGQVHPQHRNYGQWDQMTAHERQLHRDDMARLYVAIADRYEHDAIFLYTTLEKRPDENKRLIDAVRKLSGERYCLLLEGDVTFHIPPGSRMEQVSLRMAETPESVEAETAARVDRALQIAGDLQQHGGLDGFVLGSDYCFTNGPFLPLDWFDRFVTPYLIRLVAGYRDLGFYTIKHTDGNILPILDRLLAARPHALHSLDPQGGVDMADMVRKVGDRIALCGNVDCGTLQSGSADRIAESARYALHHGLQAPGYVYCTSNCIFTGVELRRYELMLDIWRREGIRQRPPGDAT